MYNIGLNGLGRIGRTFVRTWMQQHSETNNLVVINTSGSMEIEQWAHLLKYDTNYGPLQLPISVQRKHAVAELTEEDRELGTIIIGEHAITVTAQREPAKIPWAHYDVHTVVEATGAFNSEEKASQHLVGGAKKVLLTGPAEGGAIHTSVIGVNQFDGGAQIHSNASCTTNCVAPVAQVLAQVFGIQKALLTTVHSYTDDQNTQDNSHKDLRRARTAGQNIIPTSTGAAKVTTHIIPELAGLFDGLAIRVPTSTGSLSDMVFLLNRDTTIEEVNAALVAASQEDRWKGILAVTQDPIVSSDIIGRTESSIVDLKLTNVVGGNLVKVISWYDNEWGYCSRLVEQIERIQAENT